MARSKRIYDALLDEHLSQHRQMAFVSGPRQVGKTTTCRGHADFYVNWDNEDDRERVLSGPAALVDALGLDRLTASVPGVLFDELHKYRSWRNYLKGLYDGRPAGQRILVTGSARLDLYRFSGDSLQGRYHMLRLHPLSVAELGIRASEDLGQLLTLGGFPEPFFEGSEIEARRWSREYRNLLIREELVSTVGELNTKKQDFRVALNTIVKRDPYGSTVQVPRDGHSTPPHVIQAPVSDEESWHEIKSRLDPTSKGRIEEQEYSLYEKNVRFRYCRTGDFRNPKSKQHCFNLRLSYGRRSNFRHRRYCLTNRIGYIRSQRSR